MLERSLFSATAGFSAGARVGRPELDGAGPRTLLLRELSEMPLAAQSRLLDFLQQTEISARESGPANLRIIATSSVELQEAVADTRLLEDLYTALSAFIIRVPSLRRRKSEVEVLLRYAMYKLASHYKVSPREFTREMLQSCMNYSWPGNMSELEAFVRRYLLTGDQDLSFWDVEASRSSTVVMRSPMPAEAFDRPKLSLKSLIQEIKSEAEKNAIAAALQKTRWNRKQAARLLRVSYRTLLYKIERYQMFDSAAQS
jgi:DNA-binding NtrC family response regulator